MVSSILYSETQDIKGALGNIDQEMPSSANKKIGNNVNVRSNDSNPFSPSCSLTKQPLKKSTVDN